MNFFKIPKILGTRIKKIKIDYPITGIVESSLVLATRDGNKLNTGIGFISNFRLTAGGREEIFDGWRLDYPLNIISKAFGTSSEIEVPDSFLKDVYFHVDTPTGIILELSKCSNLVIIDETLKKMRVKDCERIQYEGRIWESDFGDLYPQEIIDQDRYDSWLVRTLLSDTNTKDFPVVLGSG